MDCCEQWKPFIAMVAVDFALAVVNILLKKVLNEGISHLLIITYRQSISAIFLAPVAYFWERYMLITYYSYQNALVSIARGVVDNSVSIG